MNAYLIPGLLGLMTGLVLHWGQLAQIDGLRLSLGLRRSLTLRTGLTALGWGLLLTALLMWLAVIDVDRVDVLPLSLGTLLGGALFGVCAGLCGFTPTTAFAGLCGQNVLEALCVLAGCFAMALFSPALDGFLAPLHMPWVDATLFKVTLDEPYLLSGGGSSAGGFLGLGCLGALLAVWGMCVPSPTAAVVPDEEIARRAAEAEVPAEPPLHPQTGSDSADESAPSSAADDAPEPTDAPAETVVAILEGEEPLVVDTALDASDEPEAAPDADEDSTGAEDAP